MPLVLDGTNGVSGVDGTASNPAIEGTDSNTGIFYPAADTVAIGTGGTEALRVNSAQNMGLGATPSTWTIFKALEVGAAGTGLAGAAGQPVLFSNCYYNGGWKYAANGFAANYDQSSGQHRWFNVASGTANANITFTQAMTLDASGNLGLGITSPVAIGANYTTIDIRGSSGGGLRMGTTSTSYGQLYGNSGGITYDAVGSHFFYTSSTERARITSGGDLLLNSTNATTATMTIMARSGGSVVGFRRNSSTYGSDTQVGSISCDSTSTAYNTSSDYRLKENIQPMTGALAKLAALKPCTYTWKEGGSDGEGFIAHELQEIVPQCVTGEKDAVDAEGNPIYQGVDTSFLVATLTAAIQELNAKVEAQAAEIAALKGNA